LAETSDLTRVESLLFQFQEFSQIYPGPIPFSCEFKRTGTAKLCISAIIHGDEVGPLPAVLGLLDELAKGKRVFPGTLRIFLGNPQAARKGVRYIERDLNRSFESAMSSAELWEEIRAKECAELILDSDFYVDLHQTIEPSLGSFYITAYHQNSLNWARVLGEPQIFVTHALSEGFSSAGLCSDEMAQLQGIPALSVEFWQRGFASEVEAKCSEFLHSLLDKAGDLLGNSEKWQEAVQAAANLSIYRIVHREPRIKGQKLRPGLQNLQEIEQGELLGEDGDGEPIKAPLSGILLFPKYPSSVVPEATLPESLYVLAVEGAGSLAVEA